MLAKRDWDTTMDAVPAVNGQAAPVVNYFVAPESAHRYAANRPRGHGRVLALMEQALHGGLPVERALDVGCGTGHSTVALLPYARAIEGVDSSSEMLGLAPRHVRIVYRKGYAEALPCRSGHYDLVTVSSAYHWFDHERFLGEAARVLKPGGWLVLYKAGSTGKLPARQDFEFWRREVLKARYPKVARNGEPLTADQAAQFGFTEVLCEKTTHARRYTVAEYVENLLTHSSVVRVVDGGHEPVGVAREWLKTELTAFFPEGIAEFMLEDRIHVLRRNSGE